MTALENRDMVQNPDEVPTTLFLVLRAPLGGVVRVMAVREDATWKEATDYDPERAVEIVAPIADSRSVADLLQGGSVQIVKGASLVREHSRLLRETAARGASVDGENDARESQRHSTSE